MVVFGRSVRVEIVRAAGTTEEKRWSTAMGGDLATKALFNAPDRVKTGDKLHSDLFDEPRILSNVNPVTSLDGSVSYWEARMVPLSQWNRENSQDPRPPTAVLIFISHSSQDRELARRLTHLLRIALRLPAKSIRCTSVEGHRLPGGADTNQQLKREIRDAPVFIGIVSPRSIKSMYVLFELGARWGADKQLIPLLAPGAAVDELVGPMTGINALRAESAEQLHQLLRELASELNLPLEPADAYHHELEQVTLTPVLRESSASTEPRSELDLIKGLSDAADELLREAAADPQGSASVIESGQGLLLEANGRHFVQQGSPRSEARWRSVIDESRQRIATSRRFAFVSHRRGL